MERTDVVTVFLERSDGRILVARRSEDVRTYQGHWAGISGYLETDQPIDQAYTEIREETGFGQKTVELKKEGEAIDVDDGDNHWRVHPFRFGMSGSGSPEMDHEHTEYRWIEPSDLKTMETVPRLWETWERVR